MKITHVVIAKKAKDEKSVAMLVKTATSAGDAQDKCDRYQAKHPELECEILGKSAYNSMLEKSPEMQKAGNKKV